MPKPAKPVKAAASKTAKPKAPEQPEQADLVMRGFLASVAAKIVKKEKITPAEVKLLREFHAEKQETAWVNREAMCRELTDALGTPVHTRTTYEYQRHGAPIPRSGPIDKAAFWRWLAIEKRGKGRPGDDSKKDLEREKLRHEVELLKGKVDTLHRETVPTADVRATLATVCEDLKTALRIDLPGKAIELALAMPAEDAVERIREEIDLRLQNLALAGRREGAAA